MRYGDEIPVLPEIIAGPREQSGIAGEALTLAVNTSGSRPLRYQWFKNGVPAMGKTNAWLSFNNLQPSQAGDYCVVVTNTYGAVTSAVATVTVRLRPSIEPSSGRIGFESGQFCFDIGRNGQRPGRHRSLHQSGAMDSGANKHGAGKRGSTIPGHLLAEARRVGFTACGCISVRWLVVQTLVCVQSGDLPAFHRSASTWLLDAS